MALAHDANANSGAINGLATPFTSTWSHTCTGSNLVLIVNTGARAAVGNAANMVVSGVTYNGVALTKIRSDELDPDSCFRSELWYLVAPATGAHNVVVTWTGALTYAGAASSSYTGAQQSSAVIDANAGSSDNSTTTITTSITTVAASCFLVDAVYSRSGTLTNNASQTLIAGITINADDNVGASYKPSVTAGSNSMDWTESNDGNTWVQSVVSLKPASGVTTLTVTISDSTTTSENLTPLEVNFVAVSNSTTISENTVSNLVSFVSVSNSSSLTESLNPNLVDLVGVSDSTTLSESIQLLQQSFINVSDSSTLTENVALSISAPGGLSVSVSDVSTLTENLSPNLTISAVIVSALIAGASYPTSTTQDATQPVSWSNLTGVQQVGGLAASGSATADGFTNHLINTGFAFAIPPTASVVGITAEINRSASLNDGGSFNWALDDNVSLLKAGVATGANKWDSSTYWPTSLTTATYGSSSDLWGAIWTPTDVNNANFGLIFRAEVAGQVGTPTSISVDYIRLTVSYTTPGDPTVLTESVAVSVSSGAALSVNVSDTVTTSENVQLLETSFVTVSDNTTLTEADQLNLIAMVTISNSTTISDPVSVQVPNLGNIVASDTTTTSENVVMRETSFISLSDATSLIESPQLLQASLIAVSDSTTTSQSINAQEISFVAKSDSVTTSENVVALIPTLLVAVSDSTTTSEALGILQTSFIAQSDSTSLSESFALIVGATSTPTVNVSNTVTTSESVNAGVFNIVSVSDSTTTNDVLAARLITFATVSDSPSTVDQLSVSLSFAVTVSDSVAHSEATSLAFSGPQISVSDTVSTTEGIAVINPLNPDNPAAWSKTTNPTTNFSKTSDPSSTWTKSTDPITSFTPAVDPSSIWTKTANPTDTWTH